MNKNGFRVRNKRCFLIRSYKVTIFIDRHLIYLITFFQWVIIVAEQFYDNDFIAIYRVSEKESLTVKFILTVYLVCNKIITFILPM